MLMSGTPALSLSTRQVQRVVHGICAYSLAAVHFPMQRLMCLEMPQAIT